MHGLAHHQEPNNHQGGGDRLKGNDRHQRRGDNRHQEQHTGDDIRQTRAGTLTNTGCRLHKNLVRRAGCAAADHGTDRIHEQHLVNVLNLAVLINGACFGC